MSDRIARSPTTAGRHRAARRGVCRPSHGAAANGMQEKVRLSHGSKPAEHMHDAAAKCGPPRFRPKALRPRTAAASDRITRSPTAAGRHRACGRGLPFIRMGRRRTARACGAIFSSGRSLLYCARSGIGPQPSGGACNERTREAALRRGGRLRAATLKRACSFGSKLAERCTCVRCVFGTQLAKRSHAPELRAFAAESCGPPTSARSKPFGNRFSGEACSPPHIRAIFTPTGGGCAPPTAARSNFYGNPQRARAAPFTGAALVVIGQRSLPKGFTA